MRQSRASRDEPSSAWRTVAGAALAPTELFQTDQSGRARLCDSQEKEGRGGGGRVQEVQVEGKDEDDGQPESRRPTFLILFPNWRAGDGPQRPAGVPAGPTSPPLVLDVPVEQGFKDPETMGHGGLKTHGWVLDRADQRDLCDPPSTAPRRRWPVDQPGRGSASPHMGRLDSTTSSSLLASIDHRPTLRPSSYGLPDFLAPFARPTACSRLADAAAFQLADSRRTEGRRPSLPDWRREILHRESPSRVGISRDECCRCPTRRGDARRLGDGGGRIRRGRRRRSTYGCR